MKIKSKTVFVMDISPDFSVEAEQDGEERNFWLVRKNFGVKTYMFGIVPQKDFPVYADTLKQELKNWEDYFADPTNDDMRMYCMDLLDPNEKLEPNSFEITAL